MRSWYVVGGGNYVLLVKAYAALSHRGDAGGGSVERVMRAYAAYNGTEYQVAGLAEVQPLRALISFAVDPAGSFVEYVQHFDLPVPPDIMLDSGAFSVWTKGDTVRLDDYLRYIDRVQRTLDAPVQVINLDVIPGDPVGGRRPSGAEKQRAIQQGLRNADRIREAGVPVMEVYHLYEPMAVLDHLIERRRPGEVIALGGLAGKGGGAAKHAFVVAAFQRLQQLAGGWDGIVRLHGLGISPDAPLCAQFPWWSIDSSSWSIFHRYGAEVRRGGRLQKRSSEASREGGRSLTSLKSASDLYYIRTLKRWHRLESDYTRLWQHRGVTYKED